MTAGRAVCRHREPSSSARPLAAPSWIWPGTAAENARRLAAARDRFSLPLAECGLLLLKTDACLNYGPDDLPGATRPGGLSYHLHLPLDLPWEAGMDAVHGVLERLLEATRHLDPGSLVLHPPVDPALLPPLAEVMDRLGVARKRLLLENTRDCDLVDLYCELKGLGFGVCLDLGHVLAYHQERVLDLPGLGDRVGMLHLSAPLREHGSWIDAHAGLERLDARGRAVLKRMLELAPAGAVIMLEVFNEADLASSAAQLSSWSDGWGLW
jgi:hypothetical protein